MDKVLELAKQAGAVSYTNRHYPDRPYRTFGPEELQAFYTLARADLEAENEKLREALVKAEAALVRVEHLIVGGDDEVSIESEILTARAALGETK